MSATPDLSLSTRTVLRLTVNNHPGVMSHVCGLFARRAYNVEGIVCLPLAGGETSRIWLLIHEDARLEQMEKQLRRLIDVLQVRRDDAARTLFEAISLQCEDRLQPALTRPGR